MKRLKLICSIIMVISLFIAGGNFMQYPENVKADTVGITSADFLKANGKVLRNNYGKGEIVYLRGTNAGGLGVQEFWMTPTNSSANVSDQYDIWTVLTQRFGEDRAKTLINTYENNYWTESDFDKCASLGINCIRLPLWYRNFVDSKNNWYSDAFDLVDWFVEEAGKRGMYVVIDMHGAYGSQNGSDHSGVDGGDDKIGASEFFFGNEAEANQEKYYQMWEKIAEHFKGNPIVAGYDLLNEPYCEYRYKSGYSDDYLHSLLWNIYDKAYDRIRAIDTEHIIIMEATWDSWDLPKPSVYGWTNIMYEYHQYEHSDYDNKNGTQISSMKNKIKNIFSSNYNVPSYMGEFCYFNNFDAWAEGLQLLNDNDLNWTSWTYKCVSEYGNWGLMNQSVSRVNVETDSYDTILRKWSNVGSSYDNTKLQNVFKQYTPGVITNTGNTTTPDQDEVETTTLSGKFYLKCNNYVVCAENSGNDPLIANREKYGGAWETFYVIENDDGTVSFKSDINGKYVCAVIDENYQLLARSSSIDEWEKFYLVEIKENQYAIISKANGNYVKADFDDKNNSGQLKAASTSIGGAWECFDFYPVKEDIVVGDDVKVEGYQISAVNEGSRVVGSVEPIINGQNVKSWGFIYGLAEVNGSSTNIDEADMVVGAYSRYVKSYESTDMGTMNVVMGDSQTATYYVRTMTFVAKNTAEFSAEYYVRAYAELEDGTYIYSDVDDYTVYDIADMLYKNKKMSTSAGHNYLYSSILTVVNLEYKKVDYHWSNTVVGI